MSRRFEMMERSSYARGQGQHGYPGLAKLDRNKTYLTMLALLAHDKETRRHRSACGQEYLARCIVAQALR
jgi:hypothetical protein